MNNLFSSFDPHTVFMLKFNWISALTCIMLIPPIFWLSSSQPLMSFMALLNYVKTELAAVTNKNSTPGMLILPLALFSYISMNNALGLLPYVFTASSHLSMTVSLALPLWIGHMIYGIIHTPTNMLAHLVPLGTPVALMPFMVLIELVSSVIRPLTLAVRLAANMIAGHLLLALLGGQAAPGPWSTLFFILSSLVALMVLECAVALIQAYVFSVLSTLYIEEVNSPHLS